VQANSSSSTERRGSATSRAADSGVHLRKPLWRRAGTWSSLIAAMIVAQTALATPLNWIGVGADNARIALLALCSAFALVPMAGGRAFLWQKRSFVGALFLFSAWAWLRVTSESFVFYSHFSFEPAFNSESLTKAAFLTLATCALLASVAEYDRSVFLWGFGILSLAGGIFSGDLNGIWIARSFVFAGLAFMLAPGPRWIRIPLVAASLALLASEPFQGPWLAAMAGAVALATTAVRGIVRVLLVGVLLMSSAFLIGFSSVVFSALDYDNNASARLTKWAEYLSGVPERLILGHGFGTSPITITDYSHNSAIDIAFGLGLVGVALWLWLLAFFVRTSVRAGLAPLWIAAFVMSLFSGHFSANSEYWLLGGVSVSLAAGR